MSPFLGEVFLLGEVEPGNASCEFMVRERSRRRISFACGIPRSGETIMTAIVIKDLEQSNIPRSDSRPRIG